jgi:hypothetical protein
MLQFHASGGKSAQELSASVWSGATGSKKERVHALSRRPANQFSNRHEDAGFVAGLGGCSSLRMLERVRKSILCGQKDSRRRNSIRGWTGLRSFGSPMWVAVSLIFGFGTSCQRATAQSTTADILGTVTDSTGAILPGATVTVTALATGEKRAARANVTGEFIFNNLNPGHYQVEVTASRFKAFVIPDLLAAAGDRARVSAKLTAGTVDQVVVVRATTPLLQTDSSTVGTTLTEKSVQDLPLNGRNFVQLAQMTAGANQGPQNGLTSGARPDDRRMTASISVNGQSDVINNEMIDGADNNERIIGTIGIRPSIDAISEIRVQTNDYSAESGRTAGGVINVITRSGGNQFHGSLYEYFRNDVLDATNDVVQPQAGVILPKSELRQNQFGGSLGGSIVKGKTFFFGDYEGFRQIVGETQAAGTPSYQELTDPLHSDLATIYGLAAVSPIAENWLALFPKPPATSTCEVCVYTGTQNRTQFSNIFDVRIDQNFNPTNLLYARYSQNNVATFTPGIFPTTTVAGKTISPNGNIGSFAGPATDLAFNFQLNYTHVFSPNLLLTLVTSYLRVDNQSYPLNSESNADAAFGFPGVNTGGRDVSGLTPMYFTGYGTLGDSIAVPLDYVDNTFQYGGTVIRTRGRQNIKVGAALIRRQALSAQNVFGIGWVLETFGGPQSNLATFLSGIGEYEVRENELDVPHYRMWESSYFVQNDIRLTSRLTLNAGVRYDIFTPFTEIRNRISNFNPRKDELMIASSSDRTAGVVTRHDNVAPRVGFEQELGKGMVVRGGFGISFFPSNYTSIASLKNQPFVSNYTGIFVPLANGLPVPSKPALDTNNVPMDGSGIGSNTDPNFHISYLEQFNLLLQKQIGENVLTAGYVGMLGRHLEAAVPSINAVLPGGSVADEPYTPASCHPATAACSIGEIGQLTTESASSYHSLQTTFQRRFARGFAIDLNYTWAHELDNTTGISTQEGDGWGAAWAVQEQVPRFEYGNSDLDLRQRVAANIIYQLPFGEGMSGVGGMLAKGWQLNALTAWQTGNPMTVINSSVVAGTLIGDIYAHDRPNQTGTSRLSSPSKNEWFNTGAFAQQPANTLGTERRNQLFGPRFSEVDISLLKDFPVFDEKVNVQFRAECFNLANHPALGNPDLTLQDGPGVFGVITSTNANYKPREFQFALKLLF